MVARKTLSHSSHFHLRQLLMWLQFDARGRIESGIMIMLLGFWDTRWFAKKKDAFSSVVRVLCRHRYALRAYYGIANYLEQALIFYWNRMVSINTETIMNWKEHTFSSKLQEFEQVFFYNLNVLKKLEYNIEDYMQNRWITFMHGRPTKFVFFLIWRLYFDYWTFRRYLRYLREN